MKQIIETINATLDFRKGKADVSVDIAKTSYYVTITPIGHYAPVVVEKKIPFADCYNALNAVTKAYNEYVRTGGYSEEW